MSAVPSAGPSVLDDSETFASLNLGACLHLVGALFPELSCRLGPPVDESSSQSGLRLPNSGAGNTIFFMHVNENYFVL